MSIIKGARNPDSAKKWYDLALTRRRQSSRPRRQAYQVPSNKEAVAAARGAGPRADRADRLRLQEVRLSRRARPAAEEVGRRGQRAAALRLGTRRCQGRAAGRMRDRTARLLARSWAGSAMRPALVRVGRRLSGRSRGCRTAGRSTSDVRPGAVPGAAARQVVAARRSRCRCCRRSRRRPAPLRRAA